MKSIEKELRQIGYPYKQTMTMVSLRKSGLSYFQIAEKCETSNDSVRHQLATYERLSGEILPGHKEKK